MDWNAFGCGVVPKLPMGGRFGRVYDWDLIPFAVHLRSSRLELDLQAPIANDNGRILSEK